MTATLDEIKEIVTAIAEDVKSIKSGVADSGGVSTAAGLSDGKHNSVRVRFSPERSPDMKWRDGGTPLEGVNEIRGKYRANMFLGRYRIECTAGSVRISKVVVSNKHNLRIKKAPGNKELAVNAVLEEGEHLAFDVVIGPFDTIKAGWEDVSVKVATEEHGYILNAGFRAIKGA